MTKLRHPVVYVTLYTAIRPQLHAIYIALRTTPMTRKSPVWRHYDVRYVVRQTKQLDWHK